MDSFLSRFEQIILLDWQSDPHRMYRIVGVPPGCLQIVLCFLLHGGGIGVISQGIFEPSFSNVLAYAEKNGYAELQKEAYHFRRFVGRWDKGGWPAETNLRANLSICTYKSVRKDLSARFSVHKIIKDTPLELKE